MTESKCCLFYSILFSVAHSQEATVIETTLKKTRPKIRFMGTYVRRSDERRAFSFRFIDSAAFSRCCCCWSLNRMHFLHTSTYEPTNQPIYPTDKSRSPKSTCFYRTRVLFDWTLRRSEKEKKFRPIVIKWKILKKSYKEVADTTEKWMRR